MSQSVYEHSSTEIDRCQKILFLDDIVHFAISARRLLELTVLQSFSNHKMLKLHYFDQREAPVKIWPSGKRLGFLSLINQVIHAKFIDLFLNRFDYEPYFQTKPQDDKELYARVQLFSKLCQQKRFHEYAVDVAMAIISDTDQVSIILLKELVETSVVVMDKVIDVCSDSKIFLEFEFRGYD